MGEAIERAKLAKNAAPSLARAGAGDRSQAIRSAAEAVSQAMGAIVGANYRDMARGREDGLPAPLLDRLLLDESRVKDIVDAMLAVADQPFRTAFGSRR